MKIIGITGKPGSGKTTLSKMIEQEGKGVKVIHLDFVMDEFKKRKLKPGQYVQAKNNDEEVRIYTKLKWKERVLKTPFVNKLYMDARNILIRNIIRKQIKKQEEENGQLVIIEGVLLDYIGMDKHLDYKIQMEVPVDKRLERLEKREGKGRKRSVCLKPQFFFSNFYRKRTPDKVIDNSGQKGDLEKQAMEIYCKQIWVGQKERKRRRAKWKVSCLKEPIGRISREATNDRQGQREDF